MNSLVRPLLRWEADCRNGQFPSTRFYASACIAQNYNLLYRQRQVFGMTWPLGVGTGAAGSFSIRFRWRSGKAVSRARATVICAPTTDGDGVEPKLEISVMEIGTLSVETIGPFYSPVQLSLADAPAYLTTTQSYCTIEPDKVYQGTVTVSDYYRPLAVVVHEETDGVIDPAVDYFNAASPAVGMPVYDALRERLLAGGVATWKQGGGTLIHWANPDGTAQTRSSATLANLIDGSTTGSPATSAPGFYIDNTARRFSSQSGTSFELAVYAYTSSGNAGTVRLTDSGGTDRITISNIDTTAQWWTATGTLPTAATWYAPRFACNGLSTLNVLAMSLASWES